MKVQVLKDSLGNEIGVYVPMEDWTLIKQQYPDIENLDQELLQWQKDIIDERLEDYYKKPNDVVDFDTTVANIRKRI